MKITQVPVEIICQMKWNDFYNVKISSSLPSRLVRSWTFEHKIDTDVKSENILSDRKL